MSPFSWWMNCHYYLPSSCPRERDGFMADGGGDDDEGWLYCGCLAGGGGIYSDTKATTLFVCSTSQQFIDWFLLHRVLFHIIKSCSRWRVAIMSIYWRQLVSGIMHTYHSCWIFVKSCPRLRLYDLILICSRWTQMIKQTSTISGFINSTGGVKYS